MHILLYFGLALLIAVVAVTATDIMTPNMDVWGDVFGFFNGVVSTYGIPLAIVVAATIGALSWVGVRIGEAAGSQVVS